jgi:hypothetical protein
MRKRVMSLITVLVLGALALLVGPVAAASATGQPADEAGIIATFGAEHWGNNTFKVRFTDPEQIARVRANYAGTEEFSSFPNGLVDYSGPAENTGWSWHLRDVQMVEVSTEVCDGQPTDVEAHAITSPYYCPWSARVVAIQELG